MSKNKTSGPYREECGCLYVMRDRPVWNYKERRRDEPKRVRRDLQTCSKHRKEKEDELRIKQSIERGVQDIKEGRVTYHDWTKDDE